MANTTEQKEQIVTALSDCMALQVEQLQTLAAHHHPLGGIDLSEAIACTIEMQAAIRRMMAGAIHNPTPEEEGNALAPPPPPPAIRHVNEDH